MEDRTMRILGLACLLLVVAGCRGGSYNPHEILVSKKKGKEGMWQAPTEGGMIRVLGKPDHAVIFFKDKSFVIRDFPSFGGSIVPGQVVLRGGGIEVTVIEGSALVDNRKDLIGISFQRIHYGGTAVYENEEWHVKDS
jgi:hypothetical protein